MQAVAQPTKQKVALVEGNTSPKELALTSCHTAFVDSGATAHMVKIKAMITGKVVPADVIVVTAGKDTIQDMTRGKSVVNVTEGTKPARLNRDLHVPNDEHCLISVSRL